MLESGTGFATSLPQDIVWEPSNAILPAYGEVATVRTGYADSTSTDNGTTGVMIDTATSSRGENLYQRDDFWKNGTIEITEGTGIGTSATITSSDRDDRSVTFPSLGVLLDTTSKYRLTAVGTRGLQSIAIRNAGSGYRMHIPFEAQWNGTAEDGVDSSGNVVTVYSPWSGDSNSATHVCDFVGFQKQAFWHPCPRTQSPEIRGTVPMPMQTISTGEKQPYYSKTATHSKTLGASYQICAAYPTDSGKVTPKASYAITTDDSTNIAVTAFSGSTASLYMATLPYGGFDDIFQTGNGLTWQRNKYYERYKSLNLSYPTGNVSGYYTDDDNSPHLIVQSTSKTHDLTAFNTLASAATTYWDEKLVIKAYMSVDDATASTGMGYVDPRWSGTFPLGDTLGIGGNVIVPYHQAGNAKYFFPDVQHYLLDWKYQGDELPNAGTTYFTHLYSQWGFDQDNTDYGYYAVNTGLKVDASHKLAATAQTYSTSVGPITIPYGTSMEDGNWLTLLATLPLGAKPQGGSYTYEWITTKTGLLATPPVDIKFNIDKAGKTDDTGTFYIDEGDGGIDSGISPAKTSITNLTAEGDASFNYDVYWGWLSGTTFTGLSATDFQKVGTEVSNAPSTETNGPKITTGVTRDSAHQVSANSTYINDVPDQTLLFNSSIATSQGHPSYVEYVVKLTGSNGGDCAATTYSNPIRIYRDLSAATGTLGAVISYSSDSIMETESITFNALDSTPGNSDTIGGSSLLYGHTYSWDFTYDSDDGHQNDASGLTVTRTYSTSEVGPQTVRLLMTDFDGDTTSATKTVTINDRVGVPDELVVQVYQSEALAIEGSVSNALQAYSNTGKLTIADNFYLYRDYWYRIESNDAVDGFYIDWDDGEDNSPEKANSQTILLDEPQFFTVVPHTYTKNDRFFPMVRAIKNNIYSKYYTNGVTSAQLAAQASDMSISINSTTNDYSALEGETLENGNNEFSIVHVDSFGEEQTRFLPFLEPRNIPPVGILKTDRNAVFAGIDNSVIGTAADASREVYLDDDTGVAEAADGYIEADIIYEDINGKIITDTWNTWANKKSAAIAVKRILSLKLTNLLENTTGPEGASNIWLKSGDRLYLKTNDADEVVAMVSHGSPYITEEQSQYYVIADGGESRTRASNNSISGYYFTDGISNSTTLGVLSSGTQTSDVYNSGTFNYTNTKRKFTYTFDESNYKHFKDPDDRFYDYEVLIKLQVKDNHTDYSGYDRYSYSEIHDYNNDVYNTSITPDFLKRNSSLRFYNSSSWSTPSWASESTALSTLVDSGSYGDGANNAFLITDDTKQINRLFFQVKHASGLSLNTSARDPKIRISVMYSGKNDAGGTIWKPVPFVTTTSLPDYSDSALYRSGVISFNMPEDWVKTIHSDITWKTFPPVDTAWDYSSYGLIILMEVDTSSATVGDIDIMSIWPYDDENVQLVTVQDPHHVSLSGVGVSQSVGFVRNAKNVDITDKLGRSTFKRMGVAASNLTFGGVQLSGDYTTTYDALRKYQVNNTPVYYDLQRADDSYIRFYGVINQLSEDYPVGMQHPKFGISMQISKIIEFTSAGVWSHDTPISIGGKVGDEPKYTS